MGTTAESFKQRFETGLESYPDLEHRWIEVGGTPTVFFPKSSETGFDITISVSDKEIVVSTSLGAHDQFGVGDDPTEAIEDALGMTRALLCADTRIREFRAAGRPYRWVIEYRDGNGWKKGSLTGLFFWNFFGRRTEHLYQNEALPRRTV